MTENINQNDVIFFLGAGASIEAGVPDTTKFIYGQSEKDKIQGFLEYLTENNKDEELEVLNIIINTLQEKNNNSTIDIELVLGTINALNTKKDFELIYFYKQDTFRFKSNQEQILNDLEKLLKGFIRKKVVVNKNDINYLAPLIDFKPVNIFSVNYDTCIEMLCTKHRLTYTDGFDLYWNPEHLNSDKFDVRLFKLHGSIMWYSTDYGNFVKLLSKNSDSDDEITLINGEIARPFIVYPMGGKLEYIEPVGYLYNELQKYLKEAKLCIVVGYSFRDEDIKRIFLDSSKGNEELIIILISPNAGRTFNEKLRYRDEENSIPSPLHDKVICFNYPFSSVLESSNLYRQINKIKPIFTFYSSAIQDKKTMETMHKFKIVINNALNVGHVYFIENIFEKELGIFPPKTWHYIFNNKDRFNISYRLAIFYLLNSDIKGKEYFIFLRDFLNNMLQKGPEYFDLEIGLNKTESFIELDEKIKNLKKGSYFDLQSSGYLNFKEEISSFKAFIQEQLDLLKTDSHYFTLLKSTSTACVQLIEIFENNLETNYKTPEKIENRGKKVEISKEEDLEQAITNLSEEICGFVEFYENPINLNSL
jgi:NAD-dependent SIR2 family protein deacetylase